MTRFLTNITPSANASHSACIVVLAKRSTIADAQICALTDRCTH